MASPIKIFVDGHVFDTEFQGAQTFLRELYTQLIENYPNLEIYFGAQNVENIKNIFPKLPSANILPYKKRKFSTFRLVFDVPHHLKKQQFDFAHFQYISPRPTLNCKYIVTTHDILFKDFKKYFSFAYRISRSFLFARSFKSADLKITVSDYSKERISNHYMIAPNGIHVISNGVSAFNKINNDSATKYILEKYGIKNFILYVSRIEPRKNHVLLLKTYLKLKLYEQGIPLVFIGKESMFMAELKRLIKTLDPIQRAHFFWFEQISQADLTYMYQACRIFVYPSNAEGFGIPPLEAAIYKKPVLCSSATAMRDFSFFEPYTFDPANTYDFEQKLAEIVKSPPDEALLEDISKKVSQKYSWAQSCSKFYQLLQQQL
jgi:glycosyltransferase involved in cell wall biosynthesis